jgi:hypothetical protein
MSDQPPRRPGRPPLDPAGRSSIPVTVRFSPQQFEDLAGRAARDRVSLPEHIRRTSAAEKRFQK